MHPSGRSGVNGIRVNGPSGLRAGARVHGEKRKERKEMVCRELTVGEMGGDWAKREKRVEGLRNWSNPENAAGPALTSNEE